MKRAHAMILAAVVLAATLPFINRAYHLDEHIYLKIASNVSNNPWFPTDTPALFFGEKHPNYGSHTHPPGWSYLLWVFESAAGSKQERPMHAFALLFSFCAVGFMVVLARRVGGDGLSAGILLVACPAFLVMSHTLMPDVPMIAIALGSLVAFDSGHFRLSSLLFALALWMGYTAICFLPAFYLFRRNRRALVWPVFSLMWIGVWLIGNSIHFSHFTPTSTLQFYTRDFSWLRPWRNLQAFVVFVGAVTVLPVAVKMVADIVWTEDRKATVRRHWRWSLIAGGMAGVLLNGDLPALGWLFAFAGGVLIAGVLLTRCRIWFAFTALFFILAADMINARYVLLAVPPVLLALARTRLPAWIFAVSLVWSVLCGVADYRFVGAYRSFAATLQGSELPVYGAVEAGLRYYVERNGGVILSNVSSDVAPAGVIVRHSTLFRYALSREIETALVRLATVELPSPFFLQTFNLQAGAGFHDSRVGRMPVVFSKAPLDRIEIAQLNPLIASLPAVQEKEAYLTQWTVAGTAKAVLVESPNTALRFPLRIPAQSMATFLVNGKCRSSMTVAIDKTQFSIPCSDRWLKFSSSLDELTLTAGDGIAGWAEFRIMTPGLSRVLKFGVSTEEP